jgi:hypothetical protein
VAPSMVKISSDSMDDGGVRWGGDDVAAILIAGAVVRIEEGDVRPFRFVCYFGACVRLDL